MDHELRTALKKWHQFQAWLQENGGYTAKNAALFATNTPTMVVDADRIIAACCSDHPDWSIADVTALVEDASKAYGGVKVFPNTRLSE